MAKMIVETHTLALCAEVRVLGELVFVYVGGALSGFGTVHFEAGGVAWVKEPALSERRREEAETLAVSLALRARGGRLVRALSPPSAPAPAAPALS